MERVVTLFNKLKEQIDSKASVAQMLTTVQLLQSELMHLQKNGNDSGQFTAVQISAVKPFVTSVQEPETVSDKQEKIVEMLQVDEDAVLAELEEIRKSAEIRLKLGAQNKPDFKFDPIEDIPTLLHQTIPVVEEDAPVIEKESVSEAELNERLRTQRTELADSLQETAIKDLKKAIGLNDRFAYINELFRGDESMYERSIKTINNFAIYAEAEYWIKRELKLKLGWDEKLPIVKQFDQLVRRRFL
jgi:hypothetical protein